jgi:hypothetical protein
LNVAANEKELELLRSVVPARKMSRFIIEAAVEKAEQLKRQQLRQSIVEAYEADPEYHRDAGREWDTISTEGWPDY